MVPSASYGATPVQQADRIIHGMAEGGVVSWTRPSEGSFAQAKRRRNPS